MPQFGYVPQYDPGAMITGEAAMTDGLIAATAVDFKVTDSISKVLLSAKGTYGFMKIIRGGSGSHADHL